MATLQEDRAEDGGFFIPVQLPVLAPEDVKKLGKAPMSAVIAEVLNLFFDSNLTSWDVDFAVGRNAIRLEKIGFKAIIGELWHNPEWKFSCFAQNLLQKIYPDGRLTFWGRTAVRCACLVAMTSRIASEEMSDGTNLMDIAVSSDDFSAVLSGLYAQKLGLPIGRVICCGDHGNVWDLLQQGQLRTEGSEAENGSSLPEGMEQILYLLNGLNEVRHYLECCWNGSCYEPDPSLLSQLRKNLQISVVGRKRMEETISGIYASNQYLLAPDGAVAFAGLMDYRVRAKESAQCLVLSEFGPECDVNVIAGALKMSPRELSAYLVHQ